jgi:hypothetical protein
MPGWPEFACWTASIANALMALASIDGAIVMGKPSGAICGCSTRGAMARFFVARPRLSQPRWPHAASCPPTPTRYRDAIMTEDTATQISRIETAISRIERALTTRTAPRADADLAHLAARHETLRGEVATALAELETLNEALGAQR